MFEWKRSDAIPYPQIWSKFPLFNPYTNEMTICEVMEITENYHETVISTIFEITVAKTLNILLPALIADQVSVAERIALFLRALKQRLSLMCVSKQADGSQVIVAAMVNLRRSPFDSEPEFQGKSMKWSWSLEEHIYQKRFFYTDFNVTEVLTYMSVYVLAEFDAFHVLREMFRCSGLLCQATGIKLFLAYFPVENIPNIMQDEAIIAGFKEYLRVPYEELASLDRRYYLPKCEHFSLMYNFYE